MVVVLPAPLPPSSADGGALRHGEAHPVDGDDRPEALGQGLDLRMAGSVMRGRTMPRNRQVA